MILTLEVTAPDPTKLGGARRQTFGESGGTIGRDADNSWVLPHPKVSGLHATITCRNRIFYIEDRSRNGVRLNSPTNRLTPGEPRAVNSGDRIYIDPYEIRASISHDQDDAVGRGYSELSSLLTPDARRESNPFDLDDPAALQPIHKSGLGPPGEANEGEVVDPLELLGLGPRQAPPRQAPVAKDLRSGSLLDDHYQPPAAIPAPTPEPVAGGMAIPPPNYNPLAPDDAPELPPSFPSVPPLRDARHRAPEDRALPPRVPAQGFALPKPSPPEIDRPHPPAPLPQAGSSDLAAVLAGAGLASAEVTEEFARSLGQILRVVVSGVMDVMRSRQEIKDEFRMRLTRLRPAENNPLKFSADVDDALHNLFLKRNPAYLGPVQAFEEAFADLRDHQLAMLAGMRVAFKSMLAEFDPDRLQQDFDRQLGKGLVPAKLRYWDLYQERTREIVNDLDASFRRLFGEKFAQAYEEQLQLLKAQNPVAAPSSSRSPGRSDI